MSGIHTQRLVTMSGVHVGWVLVDKAHELVMVPTDKGQYRAGYQPSWSLGRCTDAITCNLDQAFEGSITYEEAGIGTTYEVQDF